MTKRNLGRKNASKDIKTIRALNKYPDSAIACRVYNNADISIPNDTNTALTFNSERRDARAMHSTSTNPSRITVPINGWYFMWGNVRFDVNATGQRSLYIMLNGGTIIAAQRNISASASVYSLLSVSTLYYLAAADYVELVTYQNSSGSLDVLSATNYSPEFAVAKFPFNDSAKGLGSS